MAKIIILNAPPGAGKDTIGNMVENWSREHVVKMSFKAPMFEIALAILGSHDYGKFLDAYSDRERKEKPLDILSGKTPREFMIWISEDVIKPQFGKQYFGKRFNQEARKSVYPIICTDGGFPDEVIALIEAGHNVQVCRLHRESFTFEGDSRNYIQLPIDWHGVNGYGEHDFFLRDGDPMRTVKEILAKFLR